MPAERCMRINHHARQGVVPELSFMALQQLKVIGASTRCGQFTIIPRTYKG